MPRGSSREPGRRRATSLSLPVTVTNAGRSYWPDELGSSVRHGVVTLGPYIDDARRADRAPPVDAAAGASAPGSRSTPSSAFREPTSRAGRELRVDLVREGIAWFADYGSEPVVVPLPDDE